MASSRARILLIDDSPIALKSLRTVLGLNQDWQIVAEAESGQEGLVMFRELNPDVVIVDFQMPVMNGIEVGKEIRRTGSTALLILFTIHAGPEVEKLAAGTGFDAVLSKAAPYPVVAIIEKMRSAAEKAPGSVETSADQDNVAVKSNPTPVTPF